MDTKQANKQKTIKLISLSRVAANKEYSAVIAIAAAIQNQGCFGVEGTLIWNVFHCRNGLTIRPLQKNSLFPISLT